MRLAAATVNPVNLMISSESSDQEQESKRPEQYLVKLVTSDDLVMGTGRNGLSFSREGKPQSNASRSNSLASCELARCSDARVSAAAATARSLVIWTDARCTVHLEARGLEWRVESREMNKKQNTAFVSPSFPSFPFVPLRSPPPHPRLRSPRSTLPPSPTFHLPSSILHASILHPPSSILFPSPPASRIHPQPYGRSPPAERRVNCGAAPTTFLWL